MEGVSNANVGLDAVKSNDVDVQGGKISVNVQSFDTAVAGMSRQVPFRELGYLSQTSLFRKDFKTRGTLENPGQKDRLSFVSLIHQINDGKSSDHSDN